MGNPADSESIAGLLQTLEHLLDGAGQTATIADVLMRVQKDGKAIGPSTLARFEKELAEASAHRDQLRALLAQYWTMVERPH